MRNQSFKIKQSLWKEKLNALHWAKKKFKNDEKFKSRGSCLKRCSEWRKNVEHPHQFLVTIDVLMGQNVIWNLTFKKFSPMGAMRIASWYTKFVEAIVAYHAVLCTEEEHSGSKRLGENMSNFSVCCTQANGHWLFHPRTADWQNWVAFYYKLWCMRTFEMFVLLTIQMSMLVWLPWRWKGLQRRKWMFNWFA